MPERSRSRARLLIRGLRLPFVGRGAVLLYHRVADLARDPWSLAVTPAHFEAHLAILQRHVLCLPLRELLARRRAGSLPRQAVAITFDDGYADNLHAALPLLERFGIPVTLFVASGFVGSNSEMWWDRLEQAVFRTAPLPPRLTVTIGDRRLDWSEVERPDAEESRVRLHDALYEALARVDAPARERALDSLWRQLDDQPKLRPSHRPLSLGELEQLAATRFFEIGAHTRTHPHLARITPARQRTELVGSKQDLERWLDRPVEMLAYPHGSYSATTLKLMREAGFGAAFTTQPRVVPHRADPLQLPRINVEDCEGEEFEALLRWYGLAPPRRWWRSRVDSELRGEGWPRPRRL